MPLRSWLAIILGVFGIPIWWIIMYNLKEPQAVWLFNLMGWN